MILKREEIVCNFTTKFTRNFTKKYLNVLLVCKIFNYEFYYIIITYFILLIFVLALD
jgi:hypothetical protein